MKLSEKTIISTFTLFGSLASYYYGKTHAKDAVPFVMIGGFIGSCIGEYVAKTVHKEKKQHG